MLRPIAIAFSQPFQLASKENEEFLTHLTVNKNVATSTQNQALHAVLFLYKEVLKQDLDLKVDAVRAKKSNYLPTVFTNNEVLAILQKLSGVYQFLINLLYGTGLRCGNNPEFRAGDS
ncbi:MAG TPA: phage integrase N-terminal SAM-like domain-containing protein [Candidatus Obscuribacterales bacterium]